MRDRGRGPLHSLCALVNPDGPTTVLPAPPRLAPVMQVADRHGLAPALWSHLASAGLVAPAPATLRSFVSERFGGTGPGLLALESVYSRNAERLDDLTDQATTALEALTAAGIAVAPLKGMDAVLTGRYSDPASRTMTDIDLLIGPGDAGRSVGILSDLGYHPVAEPDSPHHLAPLAVEGRAGSIELHTALASARWESVLAAREVLDRAAAVTDGSGLRLSRTDSVAHLIVHAQLQDEAYMLFLLPLRALHETALALTRSEEIDWSSIDARFTATGRRAALAGHLDATHKLFGSHAPLATSTRVHAHRWATVALDSNSRVRRVVGQVAFLPRSLSADRMTGLYDATGTAAIWGARLRHVGRRAAARLRRAAST